ncbi:hypothetical protein [uncultured Tateyamaria sp.]|uniref:hypothetical protein n=1 Tax=uncultured Tateyamaria sp. TaxID=455651 RepID=UPI002631D2DF|nr:hypothetical protein [uncultured Tateyamaria sp.]
MRDSTGTIQRLEALISCLDTRTQEVAIAHLRDAIDAISATSRNEPTRYALSTEVLNGNVQRESVVRLFK